MLTISEISISGYRSLRAVRTELAGLNVFFGRNGAGKTNLYRSLQLIQAAALGTFAREIAQEGGLEAAMWAGRRARSTPARITLSVRLAAEGPKGPSYTYEIEAGAPPLSAAAFPLEPHVKEERILFHEGRRARPILQRRGPSLAAADTQGRMREISRSLLPSQTALAALDEPGDFPDHHLIRRTLCAWRFYHDLRTDSASPLRQPSLAITATTLDPDGGNLAAVFATLRYIREDSTDLDAAISEAFPGSELEVDRPGRETRFGLTSPDFVLDGGSRRIFEAGELSDGTLRYLGLAGALLAYHRPPFIAINEPESSLHSDLMGPLASMIARASEDSQIWVVTHARELADAIAARTGIRPVEVVKNYGATELV